MSRDKDYQRLLNSKQWKRLRQWQLQREPLCEMCKLEGIITSAIDVHHKVPVESAHNLDDMARLCFNPDNLQSLCISCHANLHRQARSHSREAHKQREEDRLKRFIERHGGD